MPAKRPTKLCEGVIPDRIFFRIGEVSQIVGVEAHVLRYWESEFPSLSPGKTQRGQRRYKQKDVRQALEIKRLLHDDRYTIAGARSALRKRRAAERASDSGTSDGSRAALRQIRSELEKILALLD